MLRLVLKEIKYIIEQGVNYEYELILYYIGLVLIANKDHLYLSKSKFDHLNL